MRVVVGMSGGVDSAVSALLLKQQGHDVIGVYMKNWEEEDEAGICSAESDWADVRSVCDTIGIPYYAVNFSKEYMARVFSLFLAEYRRGRTPNPDVLCNREIKFKAFLDFALKLDAQKIATGHFVSTNASGHLLKGRDPGKEQSYFLYMLRSGQLRRSLFPVGGMLKSEVRALARAQGLSVSEKKDSTGICFIGEKDFRSFLSNYLPAQPGEIRSTGGEMLGLHQGLMHYTMGQRKGLGIGGHGDGRSYFVVGKDLERNTLLVAQGADHPLLYSQGALLEDLTWTDEPPCREHEVCPLTAKFRYRQADQPVELRWMGEKALLRFLSPQRAITPGQSAVLYRGDRCMGGGIIYSAIADTASIADMTAADFT
ncbi:MAG: tRNA 2-thiouridine(34) synthase MnmA [Christensenellales bacterium]